MLPVLQPMLNTPFAHFAERIALAADAPAGARIPGSALCDPAVMRELIQRFQPVAHATAPRAALSFWSQHYFKRLLPPVLAANLLHGHDLPVALGDLALVIGDDGLPERFVLPDTGTPLPQAASPARRFQSLRGAHLIPLIAAWRTQTGLSQRLFRANVATYLEWLAVELPKYGPVDAAEPLRHWLAEIDRGHARRRPCCLRDHLPEVVMCGDCPKCTRPAHV